MLDQFIDDDKGEETITMYDLATCFFYSFTLCIFVLFWNFILCITLCLRYS